MKCSVLYYNKLLIIARLLNVELPPTRRNSSWGRIEISLTLYAI